MKISDEGRSTVKALMGQPTSLAGSSDRVLLSAARSVQGQHFPAHPSLVAKLESRTVWKPMRGSQELALCCPADEVLYSGTRGPGKSDTQIMDFRKLVGLGYGQFLRGVIFDRRYKNLDDLIAKTKRWFPLFNDGARFIGSGSLKWVWPTGEELMFRHMNSIDDYWNYHGQELPWQGWNELTKYPTSECYDSMQSCLRTSFVPHLHSPGLTAEERSLIGTCVSEGWPLEDLVGEIRAKLIRDKILPEIPLRCFNTTNPYGPGHNWVKRRFVKPLPDVPKEDIEGRIVRKTRTLFNPRTQRREEITKSQCHIKGTWRENVFLPGNYAATLTDIKDPNKRAAWLKGDWDIVAGGALDDLWDAKVHVKRRFPVPAEWRCNRSMDWGSTHPFHIGFWARANGEEMKIEHPNGKVETFCPFPGSLIMFEDWYGTHEIGTNEGLKMSARNVAKGIKSIAARQESGGWRNGPLHPGPADNQINNVNEEESKSIKWLMAKEDIHWEESDKSPGSRKIGLELIRQMLENALDNSGPGLYFMDNCQSTIETLMVLPRDEDDMDDVDTDAEDHPYDSVRYQVLKFMRDYVTTSPLTM